MLRLCSTYQRTGAFKGNVGCLSICFEYVLLPMLNKEAHLAKGQADYRYTGNPNRDTEKEGRV